MQELVLKKISRMKKRRMFKKMKWNSKTEPADFLKTSEMEL